MPDPSTNASAWLERGQVLEAEGTPAALAEALRCYGEAIDGLRAKPTDNGRTRHDLAIAWMNRGNALRKQCTSASRADAVRAYDEAILLLNVAAFENNFPARNSLGAAWMNRGLVLHQQAITKSIDDAVRSQGEAIAVLKRLPGDENPWFQRNLAAAWMNLANVLLDSSAADRFASSRDAARSALVLVAEAETVDPIAADLALKARRCLCDALGHQLSANETAGISNDATTSEASETVDDALALIRHWEQKGMHNFRLLTERFFRFGAHFYRLHQPHFLAEFVLENLDMQHPPVGRETSGRRELLAIAEEAIATALRTARLPRVIEADNPETSRRLETFRDLRSVQERLENLRKIQP